jgi:hypothetical protein
MGPEVFDELVSNPHSLVHARSFLRYARGHAVRMKGPCRFARQGLAVGKRLGGVHSMAVFS